MTDLQYCIWLARLKKVKNTTLCQLLNIYKQPQKIFGLSEYELKKLNISINEIGEILSIDKRKNLDKYEQYLIKNDIELIYIKDKNYPQRLRNIYNAPIFLFLKGNKNILNKKSIAVVGSRNCTPYGIKVAKEFAYKLSKNNINVISGLALGIDTAVHMGAVAGGGNTTAVLGSGLDNIYPRENLELHNKIIESGGCIISEYIIGTKPLGENFPKRNRIISGLVDAAIVVEAKEKSGALITADFALEQGKDVYAVPGNIYSSLSKGTNNLIKQGAIPITTIEDIL